MKLGPIEIRRNDRAAALEKSLAEETRARAALEKSLAEEARARVELQAQVTTLSQQAVGVTDMAQLVAQLRGQGQNTSGQFPFGPLSPLPPLGTAQEQQLGPRSWQYPVGANIQSTPRSSETVSFDALRNFARLYDVARICIQVRKEELQGLPWKIATEEKGREDEFQNEIQQVTAFFAKPDRRSTFDDWIGSLLEDILVVDALTLHKQRTRDGELYALRVVDGTTIHPVIDEVGDIYGYQQVIYGLPRTAYIDAQYTQAMPDIDQVKATFPLSQLVYRPRVIIPDSLYGFPPLEWVIMSVNQALRKQVSDLTWFTEGNTPEGFVSAPDGLMSLEQARAFEDDFNALLAGNDKERRRLRFLPWDAKLTIPKAFTTDTKWDEFLLKKTCAAFAVQPQEIGFTADVNRATGLTQENVQYRRAVEPITQFFESVLTDIIKNDFGYADLKFSFHLQEIDDVLKDAQADDIYIKNGTVAIDEVRSRRSLGKPFGIDRPFIITTLGPVYLDQALKQDAQPMPTGTAGMPPISGSEVADAPTTPTQASPGGTLPTPAPRAAGQAAATQQGKNADENVSEPTRKALLQWRENSLNRVKLGKRPKLDFVSDALSTDTRAAVAAKLQNAQTVEEVRAAFPASPFSLTKNEASNARDAAEPQRRAKRQSEKEIQSALATFWKGQAARVVEHLNLSPNDESAP